VMLDPNSEIQELNEMAERPAKSLVYVRLMAWTKST
jgi:hypothetical protein